jgi:NADH dehydrogenase
VVLVHSGKHLLPEIGENLGHYCEENMRQRGVEIILNARVTSMTASKVMLGNGQTIETHTVVSTVGNAPHPLIVDLCKKDAIECEKGRIVTEPTMRVKGQPNLWAAGDCAAVPMAEKKGSKNNGDEKTESKPSAPTAPGSPFKQREFCPPTAQFAYREGILLGKNLAAVLRGREQDLKPFTFTGLGELASIGHRSAVADIFGFRFSGFFAWFMWRTIYLAKLPGIERRLRVMIDWTLDLFFPRDMTLLRSRPTEVITEMHLEKGDTVFHSGEPALSFYIVKKGRIDLLDANGVVKNLITGEHFGERALLADKIWRFTAVAAEPSTLVALDEKVFRTISNASSSIHQFFERSAHQYITRQQVEALVSTITPEVRKLRVEEVMSKNPITLRPEQSVAEALKLVVEHPFNSFPLVGADGKLLGVLNQAQIYDAIENGDITPESPLSKLTPINLPTVLPQTPIPEAVERFLRSGKHKLLVVDESAKLCGILTPVDLLARRG